MDPELSRRESSSSIRIPDSLKALLRAEQRKAEDANKRVPTFAELLEAAWREKNTVAVSLNVSDNTLQAQAGAYSPEHQRWHEALEIILSAGSKTFIAGLTANLDAWSEIVRISMELQEIEERLRDARAAKNHAETERVEKWAIEQLADIVERHPNVAELKGGNQPDTRTPRKRVG